jgi:hypothetical protein
MIGQTRHPLELLPQTKVLRVLLYGTGLFPSHICGLLHVIVLPRKRNHGISSLIRILHEST